MDYRKDEMELKFEQTTRRGFITASASGILMFMTSAAFAEELMRTPQLTEGPYYPDKLPLDRDNDLIIIGKSITPAIGTITHLTGRVLDTNGNPIKNALVEIWQCDANQVYLNSRDSVPKAAQRDKNFQGYGTFETGSKGDYYFRTIKPVPYAGRTAPHIHMRVKKGGRELLTTQLMIRGFAGNATDGVFGSTRDILDRELIVADFKPLKTSKIGELTANFNIVVGRTPNESEMADHQH
ncbi:MAG: protocatechuate 3,4-dioxygenase [Chthonomonadales bacterium]